MKSLKTRISQKTQKGIKPDLFRNETGAIDLASIMVGIIVIGLIGGVIASTIFVVIPWTQDNAAKQQLDSVVQAENAYFGLSAAAPSTLPAGYKVNSFGKSAELATANLLQTGPTYCATTPADGKSYDAYSQSSSGAVFTINDKNSKPVIFTGTLPTDCQFITTSVTSPATAAPSASPTAYVDPTPTLTVLTYKCDSAVYPGTPSLTGSLVGTGKWSDETTSRTYNGGGSTLYPKSLVAGVTYTFTFDGTYNQITYNSSQGSINLAPCLRSVDHIGSNTQVTNMGYAFAQSPNLLSVPENVPSTVTNMQSMFAGDSKLNDPNISKWNVSNVSSMNSMFSGATLFNQSLNSWDVSKVSDMAGMLGGTSFNQPLNNWVTSNLVFANGMFSGATSFNQPLSTFNMSKVVKAQYMFSGATSFNQDISKWDVGKMVDVSYMFQNDTGFNQDLSKWNTVSVTSGGNFAPNTFNSAYLPPKTTKSP